MDDAERGQVSTAAAEVYDSLFVPALFGQWAEPMVKAAGLGGDERVLDVACGTGVLTRALARRADVVGLDINDGMLAAARRAAPDIEFLQGRAEELPFSDDAFDVVTCQFGWLFFEDRVRGLTEMLRVARPTGRVVLAVWDDIENSPGYLAMAKLLERLFGVDIARALHAPFALGDRAQIESLVSQAGAAQASIQTLEGTAKFPSIDAWVKTDVRGWTLADAIDDAQYEQLRTAAHEELRSFVGDDGTVSFAAPAHIVTASLP